MGDQVTTCPHCQLAVFSCGESAPGSLTVRERAIARLAAAAQSNKEIAWHLGISEQTVKHHLHRVFAKLGVPSRTALALYVTQEGL